MNRTSWHIVLPLLLLSISWSVNAQDADTMTTKKTLTDTSDEVKEMPEGEASPETSETTKKSLKKEGSTSSNQSATPEKPVASSSKTSATDPSAEESAPSSTESGTDNDTQKSVGEEEEQSAGAAMATGGFGGASPWRGSFISLQQDTTAATFLTNVNLYNNPTTSTTLTLLPRYWLGKVWNIRGNLGVATEWTNSDISTRIREPLLTDLTLSLNATNFGKFKPTKTAFSAGVFGQFPTSKLSQGNTMIARAGLVLVGFNVFQPKKLGTIVLAGIVSGSRRLHQFTTGEVANSREAGNCTTGLFCPQFASSGVRNIAWDAFPRLNFSWTVKPKLTFNLTGGVFMSWLYSNTADERVSTEIADLNSENVRFSNFGDFNIFMPFHPAFMLSVGATSFHNQLAQDGTYRFPLVNRLTTVYVNVTAGMTALADLFKKKEQ